MQVNINTGFQFQPSMLHFFDPSTTQPGEDFFALTTLHTDIISLYDIHT